MDDRQEFTARLRLYPDRRDASSRAVLLQRIRSEFVEMPCLRLTGPQARRLFDLRTDVCERVLATLVRARILTCDGDGRYKITDAQVPISRLEFSGPTACSRRAS